MDVDPFFCLKVLENDRVEVEPDVDPDDEDAEVPVEAGKIDLTVTEVSEGIPLTSLLESFLDSLVMIDSSFLLDLLMMSPSNSFLVMVV